MTVPLAADAVEEASATLGSAGAAGIKARRAVGVPAQPPRVPGASATGGAGGRRPPRPTGQASTSSNSSSGASTRGRSTLPFTLGGSAGKQGGAHRIVIAEFIFCVVMIAASPLLVRSDNGTGHLYVANDFLRLSGVCLLFFILALLSNHPQTSRFAAAFGGLVSLGVLFNASQAITAIGQIFNKLGSKK